jgi:phosphatidyl-myo-inositol dimannoside synthase
MTARTSKSQTKGIIGLFPELLGVGGVQEAGRQTAAALEEISLGHNDWFTYFQSLNDPPGTHEHDVAGSRISLPGFGRSKLPFVFSAVRQASKGARVVLAAHPYLALPAAWTKWFSPCIKTIVMSHGVEVWKLLPQLRRRALLSADLVLAPSSYTAQKLAEVQGVSQKKIRKLAWPLGRDFLHMADAPGSLEVPREFPKGRVILTVGRWAASERYKGADELIRAVAQLRAAFPDVFLVAVGGGDDLPRLRRIASDLGVSASVHFLDGLSRTEIAACYAHAEVFALPSTGEGFGLVFLEAMAFSKPVVGAAVGGTTDVVEDGVNGLLVPPGDAEALGHTLSRLLRDESLGTELGRRGSEIVRRKYSFEAFQIRLERILEECGLASRPPA